MHILIQYQTQSMNSLDAKLNAGAHLLGCFLAHLCLKEDPD